MAGIAWLQLTVVGLLLAIPLANGVKLAPNDLALLEEARLAFGPYDEYGYETLLDWDSAKECEDWTGLTCDSSGRVTSLILSSENITLLDGSYLEFNIPYYSLNGTLPPSLGSLSQLETLIITGQFITGEIPPELGQLANLRILNISSNILYGAIPPALGNLSNLQVLDLHTNKELDNAIGDVERIRTSLNGTVPEALGNLLNLEYLDLSDSDFVDTPPSSLKKLTKLKYLSLSLNRFVGPEDTFLQPSSNLTHLNLAFNSFNGTFPPVISTLTRLERLILHDNMYSGPIPTSIGNLTNLRFLELNGNGFTSLPDSFASLSKLQYVDLAANRLSGRIPPSLGKLESLEHLALQQNGLRGTFSLDLKNPKLLNHLDVGNNNFDGGSTGGLPPFLAACTSLTWLCLDNNNWGGRLPTNLTTLKKLEDLLCYGCNLIGEIPPEIGNMTALKTLSLGGNRLNGEIPTSISNLKKLISLDLSSNRLSGEIPRALGNLVELDTLWLYDNELTGTIPQSLNRMELLGFLILSGNALSGDIPSLSGLPPYLLELDISNNSFTGQIPLELGNFESLTTLDLSFNNLEATIPYSLGNISTLEQLQLRSCNLVGTIPEELMNLQELRTLDLSYNAFTGSLPADFFQNFTMLETLSISNTGIRGEIPSMANLSQLTNLDLSTNQFTLGANQAYPLSLVSLNLSKNHLEGNLTGFFRRLTSLSVVNLEGNLFTGPVPFINASRISLANNSLDATGDLTAYARGNATLILSGNPVCSKVGVANQTACDTGSAELASFAMEPVCPETDCSLQPGNVPSPYIAYVSPDNKCECAGHLDVNLTILRSPFSTFTVEASNRLREHFADVLSIDREQVFLRLAKAQSDGAIAVHMRLFGADTEAPPHPTVSLFREQWIKGSARNRFVEVDNLGAIRIPRDRVVPLQRVPPSPPPPLSVTPSDDDDGLKAWHIALIIAGSFSLLAIILLLVLLLLRPKGPLVKQSSFTMRLQEQFIRPMSLQEIKAATDNFSEKNLLGAGGYGMVYKGVTPSGEVWAVKRAKSVSKGSQDFEMEVDIISKMAHAHIVRLLGYCDQHHEQILVYEYMAKGSLKSVLRSDMKFADENPLTFAERVNVAVGSAEGLRYLHNFAKPTIIHRDIKSENILLDDQFQAKIADFGLLKDKTTANTELMNTRVAGTPGYIDPEYYTSFQVTPKSDVYSFGVVLWELITGLGALIKHESTDDPDEPSITALASWVQPYLSDIKQVVDPRLKGEYNEEAMDLLVSLATNCTERAARYRPPMDEVARRLGQIKNVVDGVADQTIGSEDSGSMAHLPEFVVPIRSATYGSSLSSSQSYNVSMDLTGR